MPRWFSLQALRGFGRVPSALVDSHRDNSPGKTIVKLGLPEPLMQSLQELAVARGMPLNKLAVKLLNQVVRDEQGKEVAALREQVRALAAQTERIEATLAIRAVPGQKIKKVGGTAMKLRPYSIDFAPSPASLYYNASPPPSWVARNEGDLEARLPLPWPTEVSDKPLDQPFNAWRFYDNALRISNHDAMSTSEEAALDQLAHDLVDRLLDYSERHDGARFVVNRFERTYKRQTVAPPWCSGYSNGAALLGLCRLHERFGAERFRAVSDELFAAFSVFRGETDGLWFSEVDGSGYLWFVEMPLPGREKQPRILNGHIRAIEGLYYYARRFGSASVRALVQAACTTVQRYVLEYRRPGEVNAYDLTFPEYPDYGPKRTVEQQRFLAKVTGDPFFVESADTFLTDMFWTPEGRRTNEQSPTER